MAKKKWNDPSTTPLMRQYWKIKDRYPNAILLFRMGDFYETFDEDATLTSKVLGITLTKRANGKASDINLAGFPHKALDQYLPKLVEAGYRVAICEQLEDPKLAKKVVKRDVVEVVTPGVSFYDQLLTPKRSHYLAAIHWGTGRNDKDYVGFSFLDATTGEFGVTEVPVSQVNELIQTINPAELLFDKRYKNNLQQIVKQGFVQTPQEDWVFGYDFAYETLIRHFKTHSLKGFGVEDLKLGLVAAGAVLYYLGETQKGKIPHIRRIYAYASEQYIALDPQTQRNLELIASMQDGRQEGSLIQVLDYTQTPMGGRLLRKWLVRPLQQVEKINQRLEAVEALVENAPILEKLRDDLGQVGDLERITSKVCTGRATPRELVYLKLTLRQIPVLKDSLQSVSCATLRTIGDALTLCQSTVNQIEEALVEEPPAQLTEGGLFKEGFHQELDELRKIAHTGKDFLAKLQAKESERSGIPSLKIGYNKVFGYYIEITNAHKDKVPDNYIRKQTLVNAERYITPDLKEYEEKILTAEEKIGQLEFALFNELRMGVAEEADAIQRNAGLLAMLDCFCSLATVAIRNQFSKPLVNDSSILHIEEGRHPVVEKSLPLGEPFIPNSVSLDTHQEQILIITGPNMAGKSVVLRQVGLIVLLAQVGSFVPAKYAEIGVVDKIFTRVGASDNLAAGESTFLVEMNETANILNNATPKSLILLDEVGRGTSTFDGLSIAWAIVEYLHENAKRQARTLFATHYHELNALTDKFERIKNARIQVQEHDGKVIFLRKLIPGGADSSYGIEVARMAGLPVPVIQRAQEVLFHLESQRLNIIEEEKTETSETSQSPMPKMQAPSLQQLNHSTQMGLFEIAVDEVAQELKEQLQTLDVNRLSPIEALMKLVELQKKSQEA